MKNTIQVAILSTLILLLCIACSGGSESPDELSQSTIRFSLPRDGETVSSPVNVVMQAFNYAVEPSGDIVEGSGHFHVMVDVGCVEVGTVIPSTDNYNHFGNAQLETTLELEPGEHTLCLQMGDGAHVASDLTDEITFTVE